MRCLAGLRHDFWKVLWAMWKWWYFWCVFWQFCGYFCCKKQPRLKMSLRLPNHRAVVVVLVFKRRGSYVFFAPVASIAVWSQCDIWAADMLFVSFQSEFASMASFWDKMRQTGALDLNVFWNFVVPIWSFMWAWFLGCCLKTKGRAARALFVGFVVVLVWKKPGFVCLFAPVAFVFGSQQYHFWAADTQPVVFVVNLDAWQHFLWNSRKQPHSIKKVFWNVGQNCVSLRSPWLLVVLVFQKHAVGTSFCSCCSCWLKASLAFLSSWHGGGSFGGKFGVVATFSTKLRQTTALDVIVFFRFWCIFGGSFAVQVGFLRFFVPFFAAFSSSRLSLSFESEVESSIKLFNSTYQLNLSTQTRQRKPSAQRQTQHLWYLTTKRYQSYLYKRETLSKLWVATPYFEANGDKPNFDQNPIQFANTDSHTERIGHQHNMKNPTTNATQGTKPTTNNHSCQRWLTTNQKRTNNKKPSNQNDDVTIFCLQSFRIGEQTETNLTPRTLWIIPTKAQWFAFSGDKGKNQKSFVVRQQWNEVCHSCEIGLWHRLLRISCLVFLKNERKMPTWKKTRRKRCSEIDKFTQKTGFHTAKTNKRVQPNIQKQHATTML